MLARATHRIASAATAVRSSSPARGAPLSRSCHVAHHDKQQLARGSTNNADIEMASARLKKLQKTPKRDISADASAFLVNPNAFSRMASGGNAFSRVASGDNAFSRLTSGDNAFTRLASHQRPSIVELPAEAERGAQRLARTAVDAINQASAKHPMSTFYCFFGSRMAGWALLCKFFASAHLLIGPELAVGYLFSKVSIKLRQPFNLAVAALLQRAAPILSDIKVVALMGAITPPPDAERAARRAGEAARARLEGTQLGQSTVRAVERGGELATKAGDLLEGPVNRYGASLWISSKLSNMASVAVVAFGVRHFGWDLDAMLGDGAAHGAADGAGVLAAAVMANTLLIPLHLFAAVRGAPFVGRKAGEWERRYYDWVRSVEEWERGRATAAGRGGAGGVRAMSTRADREAGDEK